jgi:hypothetical protein
VTGRLDPAADVDLYRLDGAEAGGLFAVTVTANSNSQPTYMRFRLFNEAGVELAQSNGGLSLTLPAASAYYLGVFTDDRQVRSRFGKARGDVRARVEGAARQHLPAIYDFAPLLFEALQGACMAATAWESMSGPMWTPSSRGSPMRICR